ncbi:MAG: hypothetical protein A3B25_02125 [Candidatus Ryanbacteria bacterium RIFCSPLOWO2_01_FULL_48_26]|uniref:phospholipase D n=1 Tax=Candidatus Ryanbacteria bacterium RIFCSPLOWO2_01_FULL_48_26 TaxID=1802126 RepID=A0A1G2GT54_9BACT|nr:MAG: hypothetical protein A3B25_02125 [Candidatus Ryanbacteria bacterium RIFCSPLOWO2_01_FULL_48_26]
MNADVDVRVGRKIGDFFLQRLKDAKQRLWVMSPWVAAEYMDLVVSKKATGVDARVITTNSYVSGQKEALRRLIEGRTSITKPENRNLMYVGIGLIIIGLILGIYTKGVGFLLSIVGIVLYRVGMERKEKYWVSKLGDGNVKVFEYHPYHIVHAKIYVADDWVIMGSANFTENGMRESIEGIVIMQSAELATRVGEMMGGIKNDLNLRELSYDIVGKELDKPDLKSGRYKRHSTHRKHYY